MDPTLTLEIPFIFVSRTDVENNPASQWTFEERDTEAISTVHQGLAQFEDMPPIHLDGDADPRNVAAGWSLRLLPKSLSTSTDDTHDYLTEQEKQLVSSKVWSCAMALRRANVPLDRTDHAWKSWRNEATKIFNALKTAFIEWTVLDQKWWPLVTGEDMWLDIQLVPYNALDPELVKKVTMLWTGVERELSLLATPPGLLKYWPLSRWLECRAIRQMAREKAGMWRRLKDNESLSDKKKGTMYQRDKEKWMNRFDDEDVKYERTKGRRREWWDVIETMESEEVVRALKDWKEGGKGMVVEYDLTRDDKETLSFPSHRSTLVLSDILAVIELMCALLHFAHASTQAELASWITKHRAATLVFSNEPLESFERMLRQLELSTLSLKYYKKDLQVIYPDASSDATTIPKPSKHANPFYNLVVYEEKKLRKQRNYIPDYMYRFDLAGGFYPTEGKKVHALMLVEELRQSQMRKKDEKKVEKRKKKKDESKSIDWLGDLDVDVAPDDAREREEDLDERARKSPTNVKEDVDADWLKKNRELFNPTKRTEFVRVGEVRKSGDQSENIHHDKGLSGSPGEALLNANNDRVVPGEEEGGAEETSTGQDV